MRVSSSLMNLSRLLKRDLCQGKRLLIQFKAKALVTPKFKTARYANKFGHLNVKCALTGTQDSSSNNLLEKLFKYA